MKVVFLGTPDFAVKPLLALLNYKNAEVIGVVCNPDKPVGRKRVLTPPPVKSLAVERGLPVFQYGRIRKEGVEDMRALAPDLMVTCAFGQILSQEIIDIPRLGVINVHASLLPKYRGASPINYAILNGETETGVTIMKTSLGIDAGDVLLQKKINIGRDETAGELFERLSELGAAALTEALPQIENGTAIFKKQDESLATYTKMIKKEDAELDFSETAERIVNKIRAYEPAPASYTFLNGEPFKIHKAEKAYGYSAPTDGKTGVFLKTDSELVVSAADGAVRLLVVQRAGGKAMDISAFLRGSKLNAGDCFTHSQSLLHENTPHEIRQNDNALRENTLCENPWHDEKQTK